MSNRNDDLHEKVSLRILQRVNSRETCTIGDLDFARKWLAHCGHVAPSVRGMKKAGVDHPVVDLAGIELDELRDEYTK